MASIRAPSTVVLSFFHQEEDLALKSPRIIVKRELDDTVVFKISSKLDKNSSNPLPLATIPLMLTLALDLLERKSYAKIYFVRI